MGMADPGDQLNGIGFNFHSPAAALPLLAPPQFAIDGFQRNGDARGKAYQGGHETFAV